jgi:hypothetical protein
MSRPPFDPRVLRRIAEDIYDKIAAEASFADDERDDLVTSIVRQWMTYDHHATLLLDEHRQFYFKVETTPLGAINVSVRKSDADWTGFIDDWKIDPDDLPAIIHQINRGQGAETISIDGRPLRIYVDPQKSTCGVEPMDEETRERPAERNYHKFADDMVRKQLGRQVPPAVKEELVLSVVNQWRQFDGHACIFIDERRLLTLSLTEQDDGGTNINARQTTNDAGNFLVSLGIPSREVSEVLERINFGKEVEFVDERGLPAILAHDPKRMRFIVTRVGAAAAADEHAANLAVMLPVFCPKCTAVLGPWEHGQTRRTCPMCGEVVTAE